MFRKALKLVSLVCVAALALSTPLYVWAQESGTPPAGTDPSIQSADQNPEGTDLHAQAGNQPAGETAAPEIKLPSFSYRDNRETLLGRSLVLSIGFYPFTYFFSGFVMDITRFAAHGFSASYAPWPFTTQYSVALTDSEMWIRLGVASASSLILGFLGTIIK